tara:strand:- start:1737 stop:1967 length:231 start_codon:yes stop_codon:yes gene_type:complete
MHVTNLAFSLNAKLIFLKSNKQNNKLASNATFAISLSTKLKTKKRAKKKNCIFCRGILNILRVFFVETLLIYYTFS